MVGILDSGKSVMGLKTDKSGSLFCSVCKTRSFIGGNIHVFLSCVKTC